MVVRVVGITLVFGTILLGGGVAQDGRPFGRNRPRPKEEKGKDRGEDRKDRARKQPRRSMRFSSNYTKALAYIRQAYRKRDWRTVPSLFSGLVFLLDGRPDLAEDFARTIEIAKRKIKDKKSFNGNWFISYSALFLAIVYWHYPRADIRQALEEGLQVAEQTREDDTYGWGHNKGWGRKSGYYKKGGGIDLGMVTATMLSAFLIAREAGVDVPRPFIEKTLKNLHSISRKGVVAYGTGNPWTGFISRSSAAFPGLHITGMRSDEIYQAVVRELPRTIKDTEKGHAYGPIHFFANAFAAQLMGQYSAYSGYWLPILSKRQTPSGAVDMQHDGGRRGTEKPELGATAVYALMILMQEKPLLPRNKRGARGRRVAGGRRGRSPFGRPVPKVKAEDVPTGEGPTGPVTGDGATGGGGK